MDGWKEGRICECVDGWLDRWMRGYVNGGFPLPLFHVGTMW